MSEQSLTEAIHAIRKRCEVLKKKAVEIAEEEKDKALDRTYKEFGPWQQMKITDIFVDAVGDFYGAYGPEFYQRTGGLYHVLDLKIDGNGIVDYNTVDDLLEPDYMHKDRNGGDLYDKVFKHGWHGGATGTDWRGETRGVPSYRTMYTTIDSRVLHPSWGSTAFRSEPPYDIFQRELESSEGGEMAAELQKILDKNVEQAGKEILKRLETARDTIF